MNIVIALFTFVLIIVSILLVLLVLAQKTKDGGMGSALGGGMTESTFGAEAGNVLSKWTINLAISFFVLGFGLYLAVLYTTKASKNASGAALPTLSAAPAPATSTPAAAPAVSVPAPAAKGPEATKAPEAAKKQ